MKKYITLENQIYEAFLVIDDSKINDETLPIKRKTGTGRDKNHFVIKSNFHETLKLFFPLVIEDRSNNVTGKNKPIVKSYFSISSLVNDIDYINKEITKRFKEENEIDKAEYYKEAIALSKEQNLSTSFFIESQLSNANNGIAFKEWDKNFKSLIKIILLPTTQLKVYLFRKEEEICAYWEFKQDFVVVNIPKTDSPLDKPENTIFYGSPGTGKSHKVNETLKNLNKHFYERITFHPEYDHASFVGGYKPISEKNDEGIDEVKYKFVPQVFTNIYERAWKDQDNQYYLAIEEINRGNCAEIFGDIFQLLDRNSNYSVTPSSELQQHLQDQLGAEHDGIVNGLKLPNNLTIWATMNTSDQSLFPMDSAFKRRWNWEYIPICYDDTEENLSSKYFVEIETGVTFSWLKFIEAVNTKIKYNPNLGMDKCIGNYFIKPESTDPDKKNKIELKEFINKAIFYLWNDVFKDEDERDSIFKRDNFYEDFFPIKTNGKNLVLEILKTDDFVSVEVSKAE